MTSAQHTIYLLFHIGEAIIKEADAMKITVFLMFSYFCLDHMSIHLSNDEGTLPGIFRYRGSVKNDE